MRLTLHNKGGPQGSSASIAPVRLPPRVRNETLVLSLRLSGARQEGEGPATAARTAPPVRVEQPVEPEFAPSFVWSLAWGFSGRAVAVLIMPVLFLQPILPLFAADESVAPPPAETPSPPPPAEPSPTEPTTEEAQSDTSGPTEDVAPAPEETAPTEPAPEEIAVEETPSEEPPADVPPEEEAENVPETSPNDPGEVAGVATSTEATAQDEIPSPVDGGAAEVDPSGDTASSTDKIVGNDGATTTDALAADETASSTDEAAPEEEAQEEGPTPEELAALAEEEAEHAAEAAREAAAAEEYRRAELRREVEAEFMKGCTQLDGVGYYCLKDGARGFTGDTAPSQTATGVTSEEDGVGADKEIFIMRGSAKIQVTKNDVDDSFPSMDLAGEHIVWQEMVAGRWQIMTARVESGTGTPQVKQLTNSTESNFNPRVEGASIVWQGWADNNWEVFLATRRPEGATLGVDALMPEHHLVGINGEWDVRRLTKNTTHDMFPAIAGELVTWQHFDGGNWVVVAYNTKTGALLPLSDGAKKAERPRFALLWDESDEKGNARMMGLDVASGEKFDATAAARNVSDRPAPALPAAPLTAPDQAALPSSAGGSSATTTPAKDGDGGDDPNATTP